MCGTGGDHGRGTTAGREARTVQGGLLKDKMVEALFLFCAWCRANTVETSQAQNEE